MYSRRARKEPLVKLNCATLPETMLESELFGHEKGAFTGAISERKGRFELAQKAPCSWTKSAKSPPAFQAKLLRVLQEGEFERVGGNKTIKVDVRVVSATNRDLEEAVAATNSAPTSITASMWSDVPAAAARAARRHQLAGEVS